jgi:hypothetical protein
MKQGRHRRTHRYDLTIFTPETFAAHCKIPKLFLIDDGVCKLGCLNSISVRLYSGITKDLTHHNIIVDPDTLKTNAIIDSEHAGF